MRSATPWLASLILHSLLLSGIMILSHTPPDFPNNLSLDFQLAPQTAADLAGATEEVLPAPLPPVKKLPDPVEKHPIPPKPVPPPPPIAEMPEVVPAAIIEPATPHEVLPQEALPEAAILTAQPEITAEPTPQPSTVVAEIPAISPQAEARAAEEFQYLQTVSLIRGQVLNKLTYPAAARRMGWRGKLVLGFTLCADGSVETLEVLESSGHKVLDLAAVRAVVANTPFKGNFPPTWVKLPIRFHLD